MEVLSGGKWRFTVSASVGDGVAVSGRYRVFRSFSGAGCTHAAVEGGFRFLSDVAAWIRFRGRAALKSEG